MIDARNGGRLIMYMSQFSQSLGLHDPVSGEPLYTKVWGYNGTYPGPTILAQEGVPLNVFWQNQLVDQNNRPLPHLVPIDESIDWAFTGITNWQQYGVPLVTHLHGGHNESASDGLPDAWFTPNFTKKGTGFVKGDITPYTYSNDQEAATIWYHDHALGITRLNVYAGLAGFYLITDATEAALQAQNKLPAAPYDIGLAIQDRMFTADGQLFYPAVPEEEHEPEPSVLPEFFGDFILVNGAAWPVLEVEPRQYRFRILNGSDSRFYNLFFSGGQSFMQIGTDDGLLPAPVPLRQLLIGTGERRDVVLDFSNLQGQTILLRNNAKTPFPKGEPADPRTTGQIMAFKVTKPLNTAYPQTTLPAILRAPIPPLQTTLPARKLLLFEAEDEFDRLKPMLGTLDKGVLNYRDPVSENPALNSTEIWEIYNETMDAHTIHLHLVKMQLVNRQKFKATIDEATGKPSNLRLVGNPKAPTADEAGWKDTYVTYPGEVTRVIATFDREGAYVWHCHILSHEDHEMMRPYFVGTLPGTVTQAGKAAPLMETEYQLRIQPNPFNHQLRVDLFLKQASTMLINIYDANGKLMKQAYNGRTSAGPQSVSIDGSSWTDGVYFLEIIVGGQQLTRKLVLQK